MTASTSREPQNTLFSPSPAVPVKSKKQAKSKKGKGKEQNVDGGFGEASTDWDQHDTTDSTWAWLSLTDSSVSKHPPIFTKDGSYFFSIVGPSVKIYSVATGQVVSTLSAVSSSPETKGLSNTITSATLNPHNPFQLITGSLNGYIMVWDFLDGVLLQTIDISQPIHHICAHEKFKDFVFVAANRPASNKPTNDDNSVVLRISLTPSNATAQSRVQKSSGVTAVGKTKSPTGLALSLSGTWLVATAGHKAYVAMTSSLKAGFTKYVSPESLTCLAFHPFDEYFATGDSKGCIRLWYCLSEPIAKHAVGVEKKAQTTTLHWHAHAVSSIAFSFNGAYLLSGGEEAVLVIWQLHTGKKEFIPRVGAPVQTIAVCKVGNEEEYLLGLADATYTFVSASGMKISRSYSRIKLEPAAPRYTPSPPVSAPLAVHSLASTLVLPSSHPSSLQTYSPLSFKLISELEVSPSNRVSRRDEKPLEHSRVDRAVISSSGEWMATIDYREGDDTFRGEIYLKIWRWNHKSGHWLLNTRIDRPHGLKKVTAVAFSPGVHNLFNLVTTGQDGNVKTWRIRRVTGKEGPSEEFWVTLSTFGFRSEVPTHASWSPDGSLLAISFGPYVTLYDSVTHVLRQSLTFPPCNAIAKVHFIGHGGRYLVAVGFKTIVLWDLVAGCVRWRYSNPSVIEAVVPHPLEDTFALFHPPSISSTPDRQHTRILVFCASSPTIMRTHTVPFVLLNIIWCPPTPPSSNISSFSLVGITKTWSVVVFGDEAWLPNDTGSSPRELLNDQLGQRKTLFQDIFGKSALIDLSTETLARQPASEAHSRSWTGKEVARIFDRPAYLTPSLEELYIQLMESFLKTRSNEDVELIEGNMELDQGDEDVDMENETVNPVLKVRSQTKRIVSQDEMAIFIDLFKKHTVKPKPLPVFQSTGRSNGVPKHKANGTGHHSAAFTTIAPKSNGIIPLNKTSAPSLLAPSTSVVQQPLSLPLPPLSPTMTTIDNINKRKKRKKSMDN